MKELEFNIDLTTGELYRFSMRHTYCSVSGTVGVLISLGSWVICATRYQTLDRTAFIALIIIGCLFTIVQPVMLYQKAWKQKKQNEAINAVLHYCISEDGIIVSQGQQGAKVHWYEIRKTVKTKSALYLYMSQVRAFIFPKEQLADCYDEVCALVEERRAAYKDYEPTQEEQIDDTKHGE